MLNYVSIDRQLRDIKERIVKACERARRDPKAIELVLVTKEVEPKRVREAYDLGIRDFGENRAQEFVEKKENLPRDIRWHFIGSLQTNKVKFLVGQVVLIHSCDRLELAEALEKQAKKAAETVDLLIQVNTSGEETKHGFEPDVVEAAVSKISGMGRLKIRGLMSIGPNTENQEEIRRSFRSLRLLRDQLKKSHPAMDWRYLSMGMSSDFEFAIEEGANLLRIGTAVFGERKK
ncbi:MAG: YggS family pyridoxal phosphate-dependent enzyme [Candidatus Omnitrophica bacterium]|nr:YggS family pyridoxal phosphate-dependent enzyme [Candidatus Omnitrophota bacterium]